MKKHPKEEKTENLENQEQAENIEAGTAEAAEPQPEQEASSQCGSESDKQIAELKKQLEQKTKESEENYNRFLRMQADFDNYKKRIAREKEEMQYMALEAIVKQLLPIADNMERALGSFANDGLDAKYVEGVDMIFKQFMGILEKGGVKEIEALEQEFDPNLHHAVMQVDAEDGEDNKVKEVFQKGYTLGQKVIRPSMVKVSVKN